MPVLRDYKTYVRGSVDISTASPHDLEIHCIYDGAAYMMKHRIGATSQVQHNHFQSVRIALLPKSRSR